MAGLYEVAVFIVLYSGVVVSALWMTVAQRNQMLSQGIQGQKIKGRKSTAA